MRDARMSESPHRAGTVAIIGRPNVGKSTLLNHMVGEKISITSRKPQTTRHRITGILTLPDAQLVFVDTPGFQTRHLSTMNRLMNRAVRQALGEIELVIWVVEALRYDERDEAIVKMLPDGVPVLLAINKIDRVKDKGALLPFIAKLGALHAFAAVVPVSAAHGENVAPLVAEAVKLLPEAPRLYEEDEFTTHSERFLAAELVREKLFRLLGDELPYAAGVEVENFETKEALRRIRVAILVEKASQKAMVIGRDGEKLKAIGSQARKDMERLFGGKVFLELWVRVRSGWADDQAMLRRMGIE
jgi:GTP-binding protein Era